MFDRAYTVRIGVNYLTGPIAPLRMTPHRLAAFHWRDRLGAEQTAERVNAERFGNSRAIVEPIHPTVRSRCA